MEDILNRILQIDTIEQDMNQKAEDVRKNAGAHIEEQISGIHERYLEKARKRIKQLEQTEKEKAGLLLNEKISANNKMLEKLNSIYNEKAELWIDKIMLNVLTAEPPQAK